MALIKTLKDFFTKSEIYPKTKTNAVYDDHFGRLDNFLSNHAIGAEEVDDIEGEEVELRDADILGGRYTAEDLDAMPKSTAIEDYAGNSVSGVSRIVQYFADKLKTVKDYPITMTKAVYDEEGKRLDNELDRLPRIKTSYVTGTYAELLGNNIDDYVTKEDLFQAIPDHSILMNTLTTTSSVTQHLVNLGILTELISGTIKFTRYSTRLEIEVVKFGSTGYIRLGTFNVGSSTEIAWNQLSVKSDLDDVIYIVSFDPTTGTLVTRSSDYKEV